MRTSLKALSTFAVGGALALTLAGPAQAAVPASACDRATTFAVAAGPEVDAALVSSLTEALSARGFSVAPAATADLSAVIAPANEIAERGSPSVMAVALGDGELDPATASEGTDWVGIQGDGAAAANQLLDEACGPLPTAQPVPEEEPAVAPATESTPAPAEAPTPAPAEAPAAAPAEPAAAPTAESAPAAPATPKAAAAPATPEAAEETTTTTGASSAAESAAPAAPPATGAAEAAAATKETARTSSDAQVTVGTSTARAATADKDCGDFGSQAEAQTYFTGKGGPASDPDRLDGDDDGQACEDSFGGDNASRAEARTINAGTPAAGGLSPAGLAGGALLAGAGIVLGLRARRLG